MNLHTLQTGPNIALVLGVLVYALVYAFADPRFLRRFERILSLFAPILATTFKWTGWTSQGTVLTTELNSLGNGAYSAVGTAYDNTTALDQTAALEINLASLNPTAGAYFDVYMVQSLGGTNYEDAPSSTNPGGHMRVASCTITTGSATKRIATPAFLIPPGKWKFVFLNKSNVALAASANTVNLYTTDDQGV